jgi:hypothetical protein
MNDMSKKDARNYMRRVYSTFDEGAVTAISSVHPGMMSLYQHLCDSEWRGNIIDPIMTFFSPLISLISDNVYDVNGKRMIAPSLSRIICVIISTMIPDLIHYIFKDRSRGVMVMDGCYSWRMAKHEIMIVEGYDSDYIPTDPIYHMCLPFILGGIEKLRGVNGSIVKMSLIKQTSDEPNSMDIDLPHLLTHAGHNYFSVHDVIEYIVSDNSGFVMHDMVSYMYAMNLISPDVKNWGYRHGDRFTTYDSPDDTLASCILSTYNMGLEFGDNGKLYSHLLNKLSKKTKKRLVGGVCDDNRISNSPKNDIGNIDTSYIPNKFWNQVVISSSHHMLISKAYKMYDTNDPMAIRNEIRTFRFQCRQQYHHILFYDTKEVVKPRRVLPDAYSFNSEMVDKLLKDDLKYGRHINTDFTISNTMTKVNA